jgi:baculoviral IAP repeat-containing protein 6
MWQPRKSTILAVLVSIQAMILGAPLPWLNEPGYSDQGETPQAIEHKLLVQIKTLRYAMIAWLAKIKQSDGKIAKDIWQEIIEVYWKHNGQNVLNTVELWATENSLIKSYNKLTAASMGLFVLNMEPLRPNKMEPEPVTENLFQTLQELILMEPSGKAEPNAKSPLKKWGDKALNLSAGPSNAPSGTSGETSISKESLEGTEKGTHQGKRKASIGTADSKNGNKAEGSKRQKAKSAKENYKSNGSDYKKGLDSLSNNYPQQKGVMDDLDVLENLVDGEAHDQSKATAGLHGYVKKWVYTAERTLKAVRAACEDFGITPARSIANSIARLERHINDEGGINDDAAVVYGTIVDPFEDAGEEE